MPPTSSDPRILRVPVLIVGAGPVGLSAALFLAHSDVRFLLIERRASTSIHPRARGLNVRTMEIYRAFGLEQAVREAGAALARSRYMLFVETLAGKEIRRVPDDDLMLVGEQLAAFSPCSWCQCAQDELEPLLLSAIQQQGATVHTADEARASLDAGSHVLFGTELLALTQDEDGVTVTVKERATGLQRVIQADYLLAADGANSLVRRSLDMPMHGLGTLEHFVNIYFRADLSDLVRERWFGICFVENPLMEGIFLAVNNADRWLLNVPYAPERGERAANFSPERCIELVRQAVGVADLDVEILSILPWEATARVVERMQNRHVFLAGDAAHLMPPAGGFGLNTGVQDAHNLAWKLALVAHGRADASLLATYDAERRPVAHIVVDQAVSELNAPTPDTPGRQEQGGPPTEGDASFLDQLVPVLGYRYASQAVIAPDAAGHDSATSDPTALDLTGRPGTRAPHVWFERDGERISTIDLCTTQFVLLVGEAGGAWARAAQEVAAQLKFPLVIYRVGPHSSQSDLRDLRDLSDPGQHWYAAYGIAVDGATLLRPDGFVAWRAAIHDVASQTILTRIFVALLSLSTHA
ncbi:MAG: FAD-dependent oxidoreductase [Ktedonobacteraceae bacterium]